MTKRKIKNWFEFIIRLLPLLLLLGYLIYMYGFYRSGGLSSDSFTFLDYVDSLNTYFCSGTLTDTHSIGYMWNVISNLLIDLIDYDNAFITYLCYTIGYEILVEFVLLAYNFITFPLKWANKIFDKE